MKVAIVYDRVNKWGGAERVLLALHEMFPQAPLYTSVYDSGGADWAKVFPKIYTSFLQNIPFARGNHEFLGTFMPLAFESFDFSGYDLVISVTSEAAKGILAKPETKHLCICLTPTRYLWSGYDFYFRNPILRFLAKPAVTYLRKWDKMAAMRPDMMVAISSAVKKRVKNYYERESETIYPPVSVGALAKNEKKKDYYLLVSRLVGYKRVDIAIKAFNKLKLPLVVVGKGREEEKLKFGARSNIKFVGQVSEGDLVNYYQGAKALIMPQEEDFGIVAVEAQAYGTPVIAFKAGGAQDIVIPGKTGVLFDMQTPNSLMAAVMQFEKSTLNPEDLRKNAERFRKDTFKEKIMGLTAKLLA